LRYNKLMKLRHTFLFLLPFAAFAAGPDQKCQEMVEIKFDQRGTYKDRPYDFARLGEYLVWSGEGVPHKVINTKDKTECLLGWPHIRAIKKFKHHDLLFTMGTICMS
jgi:hypothetical protein